MLNIIRSKRFLQVSMIGALLFGSIIPATLVSSSAKAIEGRSGRSTFVRAPRLVDANASHIAPSASSTYHFQIQVPENAGAPLEALTINQQENVEEISFNPSESSATATDQFNISRSLAVSSIGGMEPDDNEVTVVFDEPVEPGNTVTVSVKARKNPHFGGVYQFGVTAFPVGEQSTGLYLGSARINFTGSSN
ncbi:MAG: DUF2808 domain-containing protein [Cyanophyceae cyanobacterium]